MSVSASSIYGFCERSRELELRRIDVASPVFAALRRSVRRLIEILREDPASVNAADAIQYSLLQWLSVPMPFASFEMAHLLGLGTPGTVLLKWGDDARRLFVEASEAFSELREGENPLRVAVEEALLDAAASSDALRIYCHRTARQHFASLAAWRDIRELSDVEFLGSPRDYRAATPFDTLLKVGPLRSRGFSSLPGAVLNAPRFHSLVQVAWYGTPDEPRFGVDPVLESWSSDDNGDSTATASHLIAGQGTSLQRTSAVLGDTSVRSSADSQVEDDFSSGGRGSTSAGNRRAVLFHLADGLGCLQAPHADIICLGVEGANFFVSRIEPSDIDIRYTHLADPVLDQVDFGTLRSSDGRYAPHWKARLREEYEQSPSALVRKLRVRGIDLETLPSRIAEWIEPSSNVIHAPQQRRHFEMLLDVLDIEADLFGYPHNRRLSWAAAAWAEVAHSRGEAIQHGTERQELISEELRTLLNNEWMTFREQVKPDSSFMWTIPPGRSLTGRVCLHAILEVEAGYRCPEQLLKTIEPVEKLLPWRE